MGAVIPTGGENGGGGDSGSVGSGSNEAGGSSDGPTVSRSGSLLYDLYAVLLHTGSLEKGHYFALIKDVADGSWYRFDDEKVTLLGDEELDRELRKAYGGRGSTSAYMLLYRELPLGTTVEGDTAHVPPDAQATPARSTEPAERAEEVSPSDGMAAPLRPYGGQHPATTRGSPRLRCVSERIRPTELARGSVRHSVAPWRSGIDEVCRGLGLATSARSTFAGARSKFECVQHRCGGHVEGRAQAWTSVAPQSVIVY